MHDGLMRE